MLRGTPLVGVAGLGVVWRKRHRPTQKITNQIFFLERDGESHAVSRRSSCRIVYYLADGWVWQRSHSVGKQISRNDQTKMRIMVDRGSRLRKSESNLMTRTYISLMLTLGLGPGRAPSTVVRGTNTPLDTQPRRDRRGKKKGRDWVSPLQREVHNPPKTIVTETGSKEGHPDHITIQGSKPG